MAKTPVLFFRGLNTYGTDGVHVGPWFYLGPSETKLEAAVGDRKFCAVLGMGVEGPEGMAIKASAWIEASDLFRQGGRFHIFGHSTGGLAARVLLSQWPEFRERAVSLVTSGTPHHGTPFGLRLTQHPPWMRKVMKGVGYDTSLRQAQFEALSPKGMELFNQRFPLLPNPPTASVVGRIPDDVQGRLHRGVLGLFGAREVSDGVVPTQSQRWGRIIHETDLDHIELLGYSLRKGLLRRGFETRFQAMIGDLKSFWENLENR